MADDATDERQHGKRYSQLYLDAGEPKDDARRLRHRLGATITGYGTIDLQGHLERELGVPVPGFRGRLDGAGFFQAADLRDVLDAVTLTYQLVLLEALPHEAADLLESMRRIFREENSSFEIDDEGGVHRKVDRAFAGSKMAVIAALSGPRYANALIEFEAAALELDKAPADGKQAIRRTFSSAEGLFKLMYPGVPRMGSTELKAKLKPELDALPDLPERQASLRMLDAFCDWSDGAQFYRHEDGKPEPSQPSLQLAVLMVSQGAGYVRWLAERDRRNQHS